MVGEFEVANHGRRTRPKRWMVERLRPPSVSQKRVLVLAKAKGSDRKKKNTQPLHPACGDVLVRLDTAQFVRDRMTNRVGMQKRTDEVCVARKAVLPGTLACRLGF